jgi:Family of unknown function (DUF6495)
MKYRVLTNEELTHLEEELKQFLIINHVYAEEWEQMNKDTPEKAVQMIELFSDNVLQKVYEQITYLEFRSKDSFMIFKCGKNNIELIALQKKNADSIIDFSTPESIHEALTHKVAEIGYFSQTKNYQRERELEIHQLIEQGCVKSTEFFWNALQTALHD